jgi:hypothetical protein
MKEQIQQLIAEGHTEEALRLLVQANPDAILLQSQFYGAKKQYSLGVLEFAEFGRIQARVNFAALEMASKLPSDAKPVNQPAHNPVGERTQQAKASASVFISYNHNDAFPMRAVKAFLEDHDIKVFVDFQDMNVGDKIEDFIDKALKDNGIILSIISQNSLKSGWVNKELSAALLLKKYDKKWIPVALDNKCFEPAFYNETMDEFDLKIQNLNKEIQATLEKNRDISPFTDELKRLRSLQNDFGETIQALKGHLVVDISGGSFDSGMAKVVKAIKNT